MTVRRSPGKVVLAFDSEDLSSIARALDEGKSTFPKDTYRRVLQEFVAASKNPLPKDPEEQERISALLHFVGLAFERYLTGRRKTLDHAFGMIKSHSGRDIDATAGAARFLLAYEVHLLRTQKRLSLEKACLQVGERFGKSDSASRDAYIEFLPVLREKRTTKKG